MSELRDFASNYYKTKVIPIYGTNETVVTFPNFDTCKLANPLRVTLTKAITDNKHLKIIYNTDIEDDPCYKYGELANYKSDRGKMCFIFVNDKPVLIDNHDNCYWKNSCISRALRYSNTDDVIVGVIKTQFMDDCYTDCPFPVFPFIYPGPCDFEGGTEKYAISYNENHFENHVNCWRNNKFDSSVFARWTDFPERKKFEILSQQIPNSNIKGSADLDSDEYMACLSRSKFGLAARGNGKFSHREMEICSTGVPLFRQNTGSVQMWRPFIAGKHYIDVTPENFLETFEYYNNRYNEAFEIGLNGYEYFRLYHMHRGLQVIFKEIVESILNHCQTKGKYQSNEN